MIGPFPMPAFQIDSARSLRWDRVPSSPERRAFPFLPSTFGDVGRVEKALVDLEAEWTARGDRRAVFVSAYVVTTGSLYRWIREERFRDGDSVARYLLRFAELYVRAVRDFELGHRHRVPGAWRVSFETSGGAGSSVLGDLLLGINAHVHRDLPYAILSSHLDLQSPACREDHQQIDRVLARAVPEIRRRIVERHAPRLRLWNRAFGGCLDRWIAGAFERSRRRAWILAERIHGSESSAERALLSREIERWSELNAVRMLRDGRRPVRCLRWLDPSAPRDARRAV